MHLPAGKVNVSFHTEVISGPNGGGLPVPQLGMDIDPPQGVPDPAVTESYGSTTTINNDSHRRVWIVQVPVDGTYTIKTEGQVNGFISPSLAFGQESSHGWSVGPFIGVFVIGTLGLVGSTLWLARTRAAQPLPTTGQPFVLHSPTLAFPSHASPDEAIKLEQLKTLASLRDSGALTEAEFETEKRRILDGR